MSDWDTLRKDMAEGHLSKDEKKLIDKLEIEHKSAIEKLAKYENIQTASSSNFIDWIMNILKPKVPVLCSKCQSNPGTICSNCFDNINKQLENLAKENLDLIKLIPEKDETADMWNNKWPMAPIIYKAQGTYLMDVRNLVFNRSYVLEKTSKYLIGTDDEKALAALKKVKLILTYVSDDSNYNVAEFWQDPEITIQSCKGDCEDGAILLASLMRCAGIPAYRVKICAGWVKTTDGRGGHAYVIYLADDGNWYPLDWCYYGNESIKNFLKVPHKDNTNYQDIWWTFNDEYSWAQTTTRL